jgi:hypothetical protein
MAAMLPTLFTLLLLAGPGDRVFAKPGAVLLRQPSDAAPPVRGLLPGDELVWMDIDQSDELVQHKIPPGFVPVQTVDVPSERSFHGWVAARLLSDTPPAPAKRIATLHAALDEALSELAARQKPFADLRSQVLAWRDKAKTEGPDGEAAVQTQKLANQLAGYMEAEVTPRALDIQDALDELKVLQDPRLGPLAARFGKLALGFQP